MPAQPTTNATSPDVLAAYRAADQHGPEAVSRFLPPAHDPDFAFILAELVRADLAYFAAAGMPRKHSDYAACFPDVKSSVIRSMDLTRTPIPASVGRTNHVSVTPVRRDPEPEDLYPHAGTQFEGFRLVEELGRGGFARVYLAEELRLAGRPVVLKLSPRATNEPLRLARLQHTNIVPIQTAFQSGRLHVIQMPFFGRQTLADVLRLSQNPNRPPTAAAKVFSTFASRNGVTRADDSAIRQIPQPGRTPADAADGPLRAALMRIPYQDAVVWILTRLAEGLAHAHARGILHLDLKPQNVLFSDDGQPMLLDFNLAADASEAGRERVGGTWPYMAPEQIREYRGDTDAVPDARTDLFAVGVIAYELLTGRHPFPPVRPGEEGQAAAVADRLAGCKGVRESHPEISPAVGSILKKLLAGDPAARYQTAEDLLTDLRRHADHLPLRFAPNPSLVERAAKIRRRYPRAVSAVGVGLVLALSAGTAGGIIQQRQSAALAADSAALTDFQSRLADLRPDLAVPADSDGERAAIVAAGDAARAIGLPANEWNPAAVLPHLPAADRSAFADAAGELCLLLANATGRAGGNRDLDAAVRWYRAAAACYAHAPPPGVLQEQRDELAAAAGTAFPPAPDPAPGPRTSADLYVRAARAVMGHKYAAADALLSELLTREYNHAGGQYLRGTAALRTGDTTAALDDFHLARVLRPTDPRPPYQRGVIFLFLQRTAAAESEFTAALAADPTHAASLFQRGEARRRLRKFDAAAADYSAALAAGYPRLQVLTVRMEAYARAGKADRAAADFRDLNDLPPVSETDYFSRSRARLNRRDKDVAGALADVEKALELSPHYLQALESKAHILSQYYKRDLEAADVLAKAVELFPGHGMASLGRAVLLARLGDRDRAHAAVALGLANNTDPLGAYMAACVYSLTSKTHPEDKAIAIDHARRSFRLGFCQYEDIAEDPDIAAVRDLKEFKDAVKAARSLAKIPEKSK